MDSMDQTELFGYPTPDWDTEPARPVDGRIILLDLNATLSANAHLRNQVKPFNRFIANVELYREWLVRLLRSEQVILITVRNAHYRDLTLRRIEQTTGWRPQHALFNDTGLPGTEAAAIKRRLVRRHVFPQHGADVTKYLALESNGSTRQMYDELGIHAVPIPKEGEWTQLPPRPMRQGTLGMR